MDYWIEETPAVSITGENVRIRTGEQGTVMPRRVALMLARQLLGAVKDLEDRGDNDPIPLARRG